MLTDGQSAFRLAELLQREFPQGLDPVEELLADWIHAHPEPPILVSTNPQVLSLGVRTGFHWIHCTEPLEQTLALLDHAGADYVIKMDRRNNCPYLRGARPSLRVVKEFEAEGQTVQVFARSKRDVPSPR